MELLPYQDAPDPPVSPEIRAACADSLHVIDVDGTVYNGMRGLLFVAERIGWPRSSRLLALPPMIWVGELGYVFMANNRPLFARFLFRSETGGPFAPRDP